MTPISWEIGQILSWTFIAFIMRQIMVFLLSTPHLCSCLVIKSCPTLCDPMDCSTPGLPVLHHESLLKLMSIELVMSSHHLVLCHLLQFFPASGFFLMLQLFTSGGQSTGASASASILPMNIQDWSLLGLTDLISLQSRGLSRVFSKTPTLLQFFGAQASLSPQ